MNLKKIFNKTTSGLTIIIIIGIIVVVNVLSYQIFYRWDLTQNKDYSISKVSKKTIKNLDDIINIKVYFSKNLPHQYITLQQDVQDILDEYAVYSNNKIRIEFINPQDLKNPESELYMMGIPTLQFNVLEKDKYQIVKGYLGITVQYEDKRETLPVVDNTENLEYQITLAIKKVMTEEMAALGIITSNKSIEDNEIKQAYKKLQELYNINKIDLTKIKEIPDNIKTLLIIGPKEEFTKEQTQMIQKFVEQGKSLLVLADGVKVDENMKAEVNKINLDKLLENYGIKINNDLILDISSGMASFSSGFFTFSANYPLWPKILQQNFDQNNAAVANLESLVLPWASAIEILSDKHEENKISILAKTTNRAWLQTENYDLNPQQGFLQNKETGQYNLAVSVEKIQKEKQTGRLIAVSDSDFIKDNFLRQSPDNLVFFQNLVDNLSLDEDLINIRSKGISDRPIKELTETQKAITRYLNIFGLTIIVIMFGVGRYLMRRMKKDITLIS